MFDGVRNHARVLMVAAIVHFATSGVRGNGAPQILIECENKTNRLMAEGRYKEAEQAALEMVAIARRSFPDEPLWIGAGLSNLAGVRNHTGHYREAERAATEAATIIERRAGPNAPMAAHAFTALGDACLFQERYADAVRAHRLGLAIREAQFGADNPNVALSLASLANALTSWGRFADAEPLYQRALTIQIKNFGASDGRLTRTIFSMGRAYEAQNRLPEAETYFKQAQAINKEQRQPDLAEAAFINSALGRICLRLDRFAEAEAYYHEAIRGLAKVFGPDDPRVTANTDLAIIYRRQGRNAEAEPIYRRALEIDERQYGPYSNEVAHSLEQLARVFGSQDRYAEALPFLNRSLAILERLDAKADDLRQIRLLRGIHFWMSEQREQAQIDFTEAMRLADQFRARVSGAEHERAESFSETESTYTLPGMLYLEAGLFDTGFACLERGRARSLVDQMVSAHVSLLDGLPRAEAERLEQAEARAQADVVSLERQLEALAGRRDLNEDERSRQSLPLRQQLTIARQKVVEAYAAIRTASPRYRQIMGLAFTPIPLDGLQAWLRERNALLLEYVVTEHGIGVLSIGGQSETPRYCLVQANQEQMHVLGIGKNDLTTPDYVTGGGLEKLLVNESGSGVLQLISAPKVAEQATEKLEALCQMLIPEAERKAILDGSVKRLIVIPSGALAMFPFEALVTEAGAEPTYLVDVGPPIEYAPSATILHYLAQRPTVSPRGDREPVLTVGDPDYEALNAQQVAATQGTSQPTVRARYGGLGGQLNRLPYSGKEASWVAEVFIKNGIKAVTFKRSLATERAVRNSVAGRRIVHLACHGLADQSYANFFGALALTPGGVTNNQLDLANDGFLSLTEMYELDLTSCELAILSACQTNYGPHQQGEGIWALSRGFLVAGSRRAVASNWVVDDEAGASLISYYCGILAKDEKNGKTPDYAQALRDAKRWVRKQSKWQSPYYWGTFVLIGPN